MSISRWMPDMSLKTLSTGHIRRKYRLLESTDGVEHYIRFNQGFFSRQRIRDLDGVFLCSIAPYRGSDLGIELGMRVQIVFIKDVLPIVADLWLSSVKVAPVWVQLCWKGIPMSRYIGTTSLDRVNKQLRKSVWLYADGICIVLSINII